MVARLAVGLRRHERLGRDLAQANERLTHAVGHDHLTGLGNRLSLAQADVSGTERALVMIDLDEFKAINDTFGHTTGDRVLQTVAARLREVVASEATVVRLGGDEFGVLLPGADEAAGRATAARILTEVMAPMGFEDTTILVGASAGVAVCAAGDPLESLLRNADASLHSSKERESPDRVTVFDPDLHHQILDNLELAVDLRCAVTRDELVLHYQPIVELDTRRVVGFEALVRWQHPVRGMIPPLEFITLAERAGLMPEIGEWILATAAGEADRWRARSQDAPYVSVNMSVRQLQDREFLTRFDRALAASGLPADALVVEVTETAMATGDEAIHRPLEELRRRGVRVYIDDFGTGYSSLSYIRDLPLDGVKLDRAFTRDLTTSADAWTLVQTVVSLLSSLGLALTAEGVESAAQLAQLRSLGCMHAQGYYFGRPQPAHAIEPQPPGEPVGATR